MVVCDVSLLLCHCFQDKVVEFARMNKQELLLETEKAVSAVVVLFVCLFVLFVCFVCMCNCYCFVCMCTLWVAMLYLISWYGLYYYYY